MIKRIVILTILILALAVPGMANERTNMGLGLGLGLGGGGISYLLRDEFTTDLAAGHVNGTNAEPGPGTRVVIEGATVTKISGGSMNADTPAKVWRGHGSHSRVAGKMLIGNIWFSLAVGNSGSHSFFGWFTAENPASWGSNEGIITGLASAKYIRYSSLNRDTGVLSTDDYSKHIFILRTQGNFYFYLNSSGKWILSNSDLSGATGTLYPAIFISGVLDYQPLASFIRIPQTLWLPVPLLSDGFGGATFGLSDGLGHAEGIAGGLGSGGANLTWLDVGSWANSGGNAVNTPGSGVELVVNGDCELNSGWAASFTPETSERYNTDPGNVYAGTYSWHIVDSIASYGGARCGSYSRTQYKWYVVTARVKTISGSGIRVSIQRNDGNSGAQSSSIAAGAFTPVLFTHRESYIGAGAYITISNTSAGTSEFYFDNISEKPLPLSTLITNQQLTTSDVLAEAVIHDRAVGTQVGMVLNADRSFQALANGISADGQAVIALKNITGVGGAGLTTNDSITIITAPGVSTTYTISSVVGGANVAYNDTTKTQTVTLGANLGAAVADNAKIGIDWASWSGVLVYFDGSGNIKLDEVKAGVYTNRGSTAITFVADKRLIVRKVGSEYRIFYNEGLVGTAITTVDAAAMAGKYHGLFSTSSNNQITSTVVYDTGNVTGLYNSSLNPFSN